MRVVRSLIVTGLLLAPLTAVATPTLVPAPKQVQWSERAPISLPEGKVAVVLRDTPAPAEQAAADLLQRWVKRRFATDWPILNAGDDASAYQVTIHLGQPAADSKLNDLAQQMQVKVEPGEPGTDGYAIEMLSDEEQSTVLVLGSNGRAVTYGVDTLFQLLEQHTGKLQLVHASIRDRASIPWRGRPMTDVTHYLEPGTWDGLVSARMNWIDLRNGTYAFEPDYIFTDEDKKNIAEVIREAHRREILVYGAVNCGVPAGLYDAVLAKFQEFIDMSVDGLWISFDDKGPGDSPEQITKDVLALGLKHGMSGSRIATTPPKGSYQTVIAPFNRKIMQVPGMEKALWFWTPLPNETFLADARSIGMEAKPSWWHNWPRNGGGFTTLKGGSNLNKNLPFTYLEIPALEVGWHEPSYKMIADAARYVQAVVPWSGNAIAKEYVAPTFGWWSWSPEQHDWTAVKGRTYDTVYGPAAVAAMTEFDDTLARVKSLFAYAINPGEWRPNCPARLKRLEDRGAALELLNRCEKLAARVSASFADSTLLDPERVNPAFVAPMQEEIRVGKLCATLEYPEYWWGEHQRKVLDAIYADDMPRADRLIAAVRPKLSEILERVGRELATLSLTDRYMAFWTKTGQMSAVEWKQMLEQRQAELPRRVWNYSYYSVVLSDLLPNLNNPPLGRGRGGAERQMRVLATVLPEPREQYWGDWLAGLYEEGDKKAAVFAMEPDAAARAGDYAELPVRLPLSGNRDRLGLLVFMNRWTKEKLGNEEVPGRWAGYSAVQLLWGDKVVWEGDVGLPRVGCEWDLVTLPSIPADLKNLDLRLRVIDKRDSNGMRAIVFVGPIRLVEMPD